MQFKTGIVALVATLVATFATTVSAQTFENNACSQCVLRAITHPSSCAALLPVDFQQIYGIFANGTVDPYFLRTAVERKDIKKCLCDWSTDPFSLKGSAASCADAQETVPAACTPAEVTDFVVNKMEPFTKKSHCNDDDSAAAALDNGMGSVSVDGSGSSSSTTSKTGTMIPSAAHVVPSAGTSVTLNMSYYIFSATVMGITALVAF
ncbi:hypothetical protein BGZ99_003212 [Dissophora globulifera]|uniref:Uncharacterized protein n=1 Tax=Dissophora globulifera TaxID=979702 RepID=A0A9P6QVY1_9FUNG|nr:hypothetical protein BGZ99_003212 [Dissophora globulifera]